MIKTNLTELRQTKICTFKNRVRTLKSINIKRKGQQIELLPMNIKITNCSRRTQAFMVGDIILGDPDVTANMYCNFAYPHWEGCVICSIYLQ